MSHPVVPERALARHVITIIIAVHHKADVLDHIEQVQIEHLGDEGVCGGGVDGRQAGAQVVQGPAVRVAPGARWRQCVPESLLAGRPGDQQEAGEGAGDCEDRDAIGRGLPPEAIRLAEARTRRLNEAWDSYRNLYRGKLQAGAA